MDYYRDIITQRSWITLQSMVKKYNFVLIGGWAVWVWTKRLKSKDIDFVIDFTELNNLKQEYPLTKNDRLKKYEIVDGPVSIDIYVPHWSNVGIPAEDLLSMAVTREGFRVVPPEVLLITKQVAYQSRVGSSKGRKDLVDIISLLTSHLHTMLPFSMHSSCFLHAKRAFRKSISIPMYLPNSNASG